MTAPDREYFHQLPPLTSELAAAMAVGKESTFLLLDQSAGAPVLLPVQYVHKELYFRSPGNKDAVAEGRARLNGDGDYQDVRILFSQPSQTATLRGLAVEGQVKLVR